MRLDDGRVVPNFIVQALRGEPMTVYGDGEQTRSLLLRGRPGGRHLPPAHVRRDEPVNIGNDEERTLLEFADLVRFAADSQSEVVFEALPQDDPKVRRPDLTKARTRLGYTPKVMLAEGLARTVEYFRERVLSPAPVFAV